MRFAAAHGATVNVMGVAIIAHAFCSPVCAEGGPSMLTHSPPPVQEKVSIPDPPEPPLEAPPPAPRSVPLLLPLLPLHAPTTNRSAAMPDAANDAVFMLAPSSVTVSRHQRTSQESPPVDGHEQEQLE